MSLADGVKPKQCLRQPISEFICFLSCPFMKSPTRFDAEVALSHFSGQEFRDRRPRESRGVELRKYLRRHGEYGVQPRQVEDLEGSCHSQSSAEAEPDHLVDGKGIGNALFDNSERLSEQGELESVADKARGFFSEHNRLLV